MRAYGTPHALIFPIYGWSLTHIERSFFAELLKERGRGQLTGCFRPFLTCAKRRACGFSAGPSTLMRKIGFLLSFCGGVFRSPLFLNAIAYWRSAKYSDNSFVSSATASSTDRVPAQRSLAYSRMYCFTVVLIRTGVFKPASNSPKSP